MKGKDLLSIKDLDEGSIWHLLHRALEWKRGGSNIPLAGCTLALLFEKPSLRTRVSFEVAMRQLGGHALFLAPAEVGLGTREAVSDVARVLSRYVDGIVARTFAQETLEVLAQNATIPVINGLSDEEHPCQALADLVTIYERKGKLRGLTLAYVGDGNNVANSLSRAAILVGMEVRLASPPGYALEEEVISWLREKALSSGGSVFVTQEPAEALTGADVVYTDVWTSMGQEAEREVRARAFARYRVDMNLLSLANPDAIFLHPLPAHRGEEVAEGILEHPLSAVFSQAENRLHLQKAVLVELLGGESRS